MLSNAYQPVESASVTSSPSPSTSIWSLFKNFLSWMTSEAGDLGSVYSAKSNVEPQVFQVQGQSGELFWEIYDPATGQSVYCSTDDEALQSLDGSRWM